MIWQAGFRLVTCDRCFLVFRGLENVTESASRAAPARLGLCVGEVCGANGGDVRTGGGPSWIKLLAAIEYGATLLTSPIVPCDTQNIVINLDETVISV